VRTTSFLLAAGLLVACRAGAREGLPPAPPKAVEQPAAKIAIEYYRISDG
jgi:hypothetical protein